MRLNSATGLCIRDADGSGRVKQKRGAEFLVMVCGWAMSVCVSTPSGQAMAMATARAVVNAEMQAIQAIARFLDAGFAACLAQLYACQGHVVVTGMGKSGLVGQKISATLASTGTPSLFMHAAEALHGDLGRIRAGDVVLALSNSGETRELVSLIEPIKHLGATLLAMCGEKNSRLSKAAQSAIIYGQTPEACPMNLVPTSSSTVMLVLGDALAMALFTWRGGNEGIYGRLHPGGPLGRKLIKVGEVMRHGHENPLVQKGATVRNVLHLMTTTKGRPGAASIVDGQGRLTGFFTDGDLRRLLSQPDVDLNMSIKSVMQPRPKTIGPMAWLREARALLQDHAIDQMPVVDDDNRVVGLLDIQDVLRAS